ncbi:hypothetical protein K450DRAFT_242505 [Umbelopsis ramanniana AG]|uniref:BLOC-1-related complex subunit 6 C-terminal helix domain-containing protein n=1 Tax=Umbelopsis ramanniana AG TaxID=1314678 RepID=A0AAD5E8C8_UMBRA|nr:uncharacterized protein K450DRAFT_242505 [Umbelopsis ramanniana AG]KAI8579283.1 hypothetical protein K450DRAFT_242505 [Umbelopsis ramanniana AG]
MDHTVHEAQTNESNILVIANAVPIDPKLVEFIEDRAHKLTKELQTLTLNLQQRMAQYAKLTADSTALQYATIKDMAKEQDACIGQTLELITRCDELEKDFGAMYAVSAQIKAINKSLDLLQASLR